MTVALFDDVKVLALDPEDEVRALAYLLTVEDKLEETVVSIWTEDVVALEVEGANGIPELLEEVTYGVT